MEPAGECESKAVCIHAATGIWGHKATGLETFTISLTKDTLQKHILTHFVLCHY